MMVTAKGEQINSEILPLHQIFLWPVEKQKQLRKEVEYLIANAFPKISTKGLHFLAGMYFPEPHERRCRSAILLRNKSDKLIAATVWDDREIEYDGKMLKGIYLILCTVLQEYQGIGLGQAMATRLFQDFKPDVLLSTSYQSPFLHALIRLLKKGVISDFEVYPHLDQNPEGEVLRTLPFTKLDFAITVFKELYSGVVNGEQDEVDKALQDLTVIMVRKNAHGEIYDFDPWKKNGRKDTLADALGITGHDGVLMVFEKLGIQVQDWCSHISSTVKQRIGSSSTAQRSLVKSTQIPVRGKNALIDMEVITTEQILFWSAEAREKLRKELESIIPHVFPKEEDWSEFIESYFVRPGERFHRQVFLLRNEAGRLIGTAIFDHGQIEYRESIVRAVNIVVRAILPEYQGSGLGKTIATKILAELQPDILLTTCIQSASLHSWINLSQRRVITGFDVYPRIERKEGKDLLVTLPYKDLDFMIHVFKDTYLRLVDGSRERLRNAMRNLTVNMVRKNLDMYDKHFHPWEQNGREDTLARALGVTDRDGILVMFRSQNLRTSHQRHLNAD